LVHFSLFWGHIHNGRNFKKLKFKSRCVGEHLRFILGQYYNYIIICPHQVKDGDGDGDATATATRRRRRRDGDGGQPENY